jgi:hypothetical protein
MAARTVLPCITALALPPNGGNREALPAGPAVSFMRLVRQKRRTVARALSASGATGVFQRVRCRLPGGRCPGQRRGAPRGVATDQPCRESTCRAASRRSRPPRVR